ncbi:MAG: substrate-binding domain-containing protein [Devosia sp.]|uniref:substrate-binding domain-containing protein n=1 Tax=Devosia sp. 66-22 TaxID=1895753 RepID=UPI000927ACC8|nr:substrate-binding domain-containing protein [Devosia sp. 66-22]MBN9347725.1 substrate-binding domain-containing protein [Devosia sp.]OJX47957.1 MAG: hypothetical protein BGO81_21685 [Devosia sp. 66-22]
MDFSAPELSDETAAREWLEAAMWPAGPVCPHCGERSHITRLAGGSHRRGLHKCNTCNGHFTVTVGSLFARSKVPLHLWLRAIRYLVDADTANPAAGLSAALELSAKTTSYLVQRIVMAVAAGTFPSIIGPDEMVRLVRACRTLDRSGGKRDVVVPALAARSAGGSKAPPLADGPASLGARASHVMDERRAYKHSPATEITNRGRQEVTGVLVSAAAYLPGSPMLNRLTARLQSAARMVLIVEVGCSEDADAAVLQLLHHGVHSILSLHHSPSDESAADCSRADVPLVVLSPEAGRAEGAFYISCDNEAAGRLGADALISGEHANIAYIRGPRKLRSDEDRLRGLVHRLEECGGRLWAVDEGGLTYEDGYAAASRLFTAHTKPDALFCHNDLVAMGALDAVRTEFRLSVPRDVAVLGFGNLSMSSWPTYQLDTIEQPVEDMIDAALTLLQLSHEDRESRGRSELFAGRLLRRKTIRTPS